MLIKAADDKQRDIDVLQGLLVRRDVDEDTRQRIERQLRTMSAGRKGEDDAAYHIEFHTANGRNFATIHDLRIEHEDFVAQIDHLVINRLLQIWVCESKSFAEGVSINEYGEWSGFYRGKPWGIPSPVEQNRRHIVLLERLFESGRVQFPKRLGLLAIKPKLHGVVLISNRARIARPKATVDGVDTVIKVENFWGLIQKQFDDRSVNLFTRAMWQHTLEKFSRELAALHQPVAVDWAARFGLDRTPPAHEAGSATITAPANPKPAHSYLCANCSGSVSSKEAFFCRINKERFAGKLYCRDCQHQVAPIPRAKGA